MTKETRAATSLLASAFLMFSNLLPVNAQTPDSDGLQGTGAAPSRQIRVADFETNTPFKAFPAGKASASIVSTTAAHGNKSIRFEFDADGKTPASLVLPVTGNMSEYDCIAFNYYCENDNGATCTVTVHGKVDNPQSEVSSHFAKLKVSEGRDGWTPAQFVKDKTLKIRTKGDVKSDWAEITAVSFDFSKEMKGKIVFYADNVRFEKTNADSARNLLYNSSFEITATGDVPDGWRRDTLPPFGREIWSVDENNAWHGKKSVRIGHVSKSAICWTKNLRLVQGQEYTFSIYMKSDRPGTKASITLSAFTKPSRTDVTVDKAWARHTFSGKAQSTQTSIVVQLLSEGILWLDAAQMEEGGNASDYNCPVPANEEKREADTALPAKPAYVKKTAIKHAGAPPVLDGILNEKCWTEASDLKDFVKVDQNQPATEKTVAKLTYDDEAIYIGVTAECSDTETLRKNIKNTNTPWAADCVEVFMDFNNKGKSYYHFASDAAGHKYSARYSYDAASRSKKGILWFGDWQSAGKINKDNWTLEIRIPYTYLELDGDLKPDHKITMNICRTKPDDKGGKPSSSSWTFSDGGFHKLPNFGEIESFDVNALSPYKINVLDIGLNNGNAEAVMKNNTGKDLDLNVLFSADTAKGVIESDSVKVKIQKDGTGRIASAMKMESDGLCRISLRGTDSSGKVRVISQPADLKISGTNQIRFLGTEFDFYTSESTVRSRGIFETGEKEIRGVTSRIVILDALDKEVFRKDFEAEKGLNNWDFNISEFKYGTFTLKFSLFDRNGKEINSGLSTFRKLKPSKNEVRINRWGRFPVVNGKPFIGCGYFDESIGKKLPMNTWRAILQDMAKANCNTALCYTGLRTDLSSALQEYLDEADKHGIKIWVHLEGMIATYALPKAKGVNDKFKNADDAEKALRETVTKYKDHPALLGWCTYDEPGNRPNIFTSEVVYSSYKLVKELDPYHPCMLSHITHMGEAGIYGKATDIALIPYLARGGRYDHLLNELWDFGLPIFANPPCYGASSNRDREPTPGEQRAAIYKAVIIGARGIYSYVYRGASENTWNEMAKTFAELRQFSDILCETSQPVPAAISPKSDDEDIFVLIKSHNGKQYVFLVNTAPGKQLDIELYHQGIEALKSVKKVAGEGTASFNKETGKLNIGIAGQSSAVYEIENY